MVVNDKLFYDKEYAENNHENDDQHITEPLFIPDVICDNHKCYLVDSW